MIQRNNINSVCIINCFDTYEHRVDLLYAYFKKISKEVKVITSDYRHIEKCKRCDVKKDFRFISVISYDKNLSIKRLISHIMFGKSAFKVIKNDRYDLLWVLVPPNSLVKSAVHYKLQHSETMLVFDLIDLWPETMPISKIKGLPFFKYWKRIRDKYLDIADQIITECNLYQTSLPDNIIKKKIHTVYLARDIVEVNEKLNLMNDRIALCYLGSINNIIDVDTISKIIKGIQVYKPVEMHIIGDGEKRGNLIAECQKCGAEVIFHGKIYSMEEKYKIYSRCHYGLNIMKKTVCVGLTMKSLDYFEAGLPLINNIQGDTWEMVRDYGLGYNISSAVDYQEIVNYNDQMREKVKNFYINNFSVEKFNFEIDKIVSEMR